MHSYGCFRRDVSITPAARPRHIPTFLYYTRPQPNEVGFHPSQADFTLRSKISFAVRQISLRIRYTTLCIIVNDLVLTPLQPIKCPWPWGVGGRGSGAAGVFHQCKQRKRLHTYLLQFNHCKNSIRQMVPFRGIATARQIQSLLAMT